MAATIRRLYLYLVAFISLNLAVNSLLNLVRIVLDQWDPGHGRLYLAGIAWRSEARPFVAPLLVSSVVYAVHWLLGQYFVRAPLCKKEKAPVNEMDADDRGSRVRSVYLCGVLTVATSMFLCDGCDLVNRVLSTGLDRLLTDYHQYHQQAVCLSLLVNLTVAGALWASHWLVLRRDRRILAELPRTTIATRTTPKQKLVRGMWAFVVLAWLSPVVVFLLFFVVLSGLSCRFSPALAESLLYTQGVWSWPIAALILIGILGIVMAPAWAGIRFTHRGLGITDGTWLRRQLGIIGSCALSTLSWIGLFLLFVLLIVVQSDWEHNPGFRLLGQVIFIFELLTHVLSWSQPASEMARDTWVRIALMVFLKFVLSAYVSAALGTLVRRVRHRHQQVG